MESSEFKEGVSFMYKGKRMGKADPHYANIDVKDKVTAVIGNFVHTDLLAFHNCSEYAQACEIIKPDLMILRVTQRNAQGEICGYSHCLNEGRAKELRDHSAYTSGIYDDYATILIHDDGLIDKQIVRLLNKIAKRP